MSLYDHPLPPADYGAYRALGDEMLTFALPYFERYCERQYAVCKQAKHESGKFSFYCSDVDLDTATARVGEISCRLQFIGRIHEGRWRWAWDEPPGIYPVESLRDALHLRAYGEAHGIEWLTRSGWPARIWTQTYALEALAVVLNNADGCASEGAGYLLGKRLPAHGADSVYMNVYLDQPPKREKPAPQDIIRHVINLVGGDYHRLQTSIPNYLGNLPPELRTLEKSAPNIPQHIDYFPENEAVFSPAQPWLGKHFLPLISFDLASLDPALGNVRLHLLKPVEPYNGVIGMETAHAHTDYCGENWIAFHLEDDGTYRFLAEESYFLGDTGDKYAAEYFSKVRDSYDLMKRSYQASGYLVKPEPEISRSGLPRFQSLPDFMPVFWQGNWSGTNPPPAFTTGEEYDDWDKEADIRYQGNKFICIATSAGYDWGEGGADTMFLLYEPQSRLVVMTFDYS